MTEIEMPNGTRATIQDGTWSSTTLGLANMLERLMVGYDPSPADGDPEYARAHHVATKVSGRIVNRTPSYEHVPGRV